LLSHLFLFVNKDVILLHWTITIAGAPAAVAFRLEAPAAPTLAAVPARRRDEDVI
jgi:hypothetical protein